MKMSIDRSNLVVNPHKTRSAFGLIRTVDLTETLNRTARNQRTRFAIFPSRYDHLSESGPTYQYRPITAVGRWHDVGPGHQLNFDKK